jgi:hypothetical protein
MAIRTSPYDTAQDALNAAIVFANDAGSPAGMSGNVLNPNRNPAVLPALQERYRYLQQRWISGGVDTFTKDSIVYALPLPATSNPSILMELTYNGFYNGQVWCGPNITAPAWSSSVTYQQDQTVTFGSTYYVALPNNQNNLNQTPDTSPSFWSPFNNLGPTLPADLIKPLEIYERFSGGNRWVRMTSLPDSLNGTRIQPRYGSWLFENDRMFLPGNSQVSDLKIKYLCMAPDINSLNSPLMVRNCRTALAYLVLAALAAGRGGAQADYFDNKAEQAINQVINQTARKQLYQTFNRQLFRGPRGRRGGGY